MNHVVRVLACSPNAHTVVATSRLSMRTSNVFHVAGVTAVVTNAVLLLRER